jgi:crossover junction endodeoxyribonuclease RuvC
MGTAQAGGVIALAAAKRDIDVHFHTPSEVKAAVTGNGGTGRTGAGGGLTTDTGDPPTHR